MLPKVTYLYNFIYKLLIVFLLDFFTNNLFFRLHVIVVLYCVYACPTALTLMSQHNIKLLIKQ